VNQLKCWKNNQLIHANQQIVYEIHLKSKRAKTKRQKSLINILQMDITENQVSNWTDQKTQLSKTEDFSNLYVL